MTKLSHRGLDRKIRRLDHFGGIFTLHNLCAVNIVSYPIAFMVLIDNNWISVFITNNDVEIMDSAGYFANKTIPNELCNILSSHISNKNFYVTPQLHSSSQSVSENFSISYIFTKILIGKTLSEFCELFSQNFSENSDIINNIMQTISDLSH